jgi:hypothetical protein
VWRAHFGNLGRRADCFGFHPLLRRRPSGAVLLALEQQFSDDVTRATQLGNELNLRLQRGLTALDRDTLDTGIALGERVEAVKARVS